MKQTIKATVWLRKDMYGNWFPFRIASDKGVWDARTLCDDDKFVEIEIEVPEDETVK